MEKIVQLRESEYERLKEQADMTQVAMDAEIERVIKDKCKLTVELQMDVGNDWNDVFHIRPVVTARPGYYCKNGGENFVNAISYDACRKIADKIKSWMEGQIRDRYKVDVETVNEYRLARKNQWKWNTAFLILSLTGWLVALFLIFK